MNKMRLILHIGAAKCGSSAIQAYLSLNRANLLNNGILSPDLELGLDSEFKGQQIWQIEKIAALENRVDVLTDVLEKLRAHMIQVGLHTLIISAENISNRPDLAAVFQKAATGFETQIVFYVRRQDDYLISAWQQWDLKEESTLEQILDGQRARNLDWNAIISPWADSFGDGNVIIRAFRRDKLTDNDAVQDFFWSLGLSQENCTPLPDAANRSFNEHLGDLAHRIQDVFENQHDNRFFSVIIDLLGNDGYKTGSASLLLTLEQRRKIMAGYDKSNQDLKRRFLPEFGDSPLFEAPTEKNVNTMSDIEKLRAENALLMRCVYKLAQKLQA